MRAVSIVINARLQSSRLPRKLIKPFAGSSLIEIALDKLARIQTSHKYLAAYDPEILDLYYPYSDRVSLLRRAPESVKKGMVPHTVAFKHFGDVPDDYILIMNPCHPFVDVSTYDQALEKFIEGDCRTMTSVVCKHNIFFDYEHRVLNSSSDKEIQTHKQFPVYEMAHVFHIIDKQRFLNEGKMWEYGKDDPALFIVNKRTAMDVDDENDFNVCQQLFNIME